MKTSSKSFYVTTPVFNAAKPPRIGQLYSSVSADAISRYRKMCNDKVFFLTGAVSPYTESKGSDRPDYVSTFQEAWSSLTLGYDYMLTSQDEAHHIAAFRFLSLLRDKGFIYQAKFDEENHHWSADDPIERESDSLYFFKLSDLKGQLEEFYEDNPTFVVPQSSRNRIIELSRQNLKDICICEGTIAETIDSSTIRYSRWFAALVGYLSGIGYGSDEKRFSELWPAEVQLAGEYAITSQALYWPTILMAAGIEPPRHILVNRRLSFQLKPEDEEKPDLSPVMSVLPEDVLRYVLLRKVNLEEESVITLEDVQEVVNNDLSKGLAGQIARVSKMIDNYFDGKIPEKGLPNAADEELIRYCRETVKLYRENFVGLNIAKALDNIWELISVFSRYLVATEPWKMVRDTTKRDRLAAILYNLAEALRIICILLYPILPSASLKMLVQLGASGDSAALTVENLNWGGLKPGDSIVQSEPVFTSLKVKKLLARVESGQGAQASSPENESFVPLAPEVAIEDFAKIDMRVAKILEAERVAKSKKLIKLQVDLGFEKRQVVAGIGEEYDPSELPGKVVAIVANLKPAKLMGEVSRGMIVAASDNGKPSLVVYDKNAKIGSRLA